MGVATYNVSLSKVAQLFMEGFVRDCKLREADAFNAFMETQKASKLGPLSYLELTGFPAILEIEREFLPEQTAAKWRGIDR